MIYLGIDPGLGGALAVIDGERVTLHDTPVCVAKKREYLAAEMAELLRPYAGRAFAIIEAVSGRPGEGAAAARSIGYGHGLWCGMLAALGIGHEIATPSVWKRHYGLIGVDKSASRQRAQALFPGCVEALRRVRDDGRAEALLMAEWGRRRRGEP